MMKRKHRVVVEVTASKLVTEKGAVALMQRLMDRIDIEKEPVGTHAGSDLYVDRLKVKSYWRTVANETTNWGVKLDQLEALARVIIDKVTELRQEEGEL